MNEMNVIRASDVNVFTTADASAFVDLSDGEDHCFEMGKDHKTILLFDNTSNDSAAAIEIKAGNGIQGVRGLKKDIPAGKCAIVCLDSGRFKNVYGENKGKVVIWGDSGRVAVLEAP